MGFLFVSNIDYKEFPYYIEWYCELCKIYMKIVSYENFTLDNKE